MRKKAGIKPKQQRSIATKSRIKETAKKLFSEKGYDKVTSNHIAAEANVPIGSFYNYFGNKKGLLLDLMDDFHEAYNKDTIAQINEVVKGITSKEIAIQILEPLIKNTIYSPSLMDPFLKVLISLQFSDPDVMAFSKKIRVIEIKSITKLLETIHQFHPQKNIPLKAKLMHILLENVAIYNTQVGTNFNSNQLISETTDMIKKYLFTDDDSTLT